MTQILYKISNIANPGIIGYFFGAYLLDENIGYAIVTQIEENRYVLSKIFVQESYRNNGIGTILIKRIISFLKEIDAVSLQINYGKDIMRNAFEHFLSQFVWSETEMMCTFYRIDTAKTIKTYIDRFFRGNQMSGIAIKFYEYLDNEEKKYLTHYADKYVTNFSNPFKEDKCIVPQLSVFAFDKQGEIAGWIIVENLKKDELSFTLSYIVKEYQPSGLGLKLQYEIFKRAKELNLAKKYPFVTFESYNDDARNSKLYELLFEKSIVSRFPCYRKTMRL